MNQPTDRDLFETTSVVRGLAELLSARPAARKVTAAVRQLHEDADNQCGLGAGFALLARWDRHVAVELAPLLFGPATAPSSGWRGWLLLSNPILPAAALLTDWYDGHLGRLGQSGRSPGPLDPDTRLGVHLLLLAAFAPAQTNVVPLARRFTATAPDVVLREALKALTLATESHPDPTVVDNLEVALSNSASLRQPLRRRDAQTLDRSCAAGAVPAARLQWPQIG